MALPPRPPQHSNLRQDYQPLSRPLPRAVTQRVHQQPATTRGFPLFPLLVACLIVVLALQGLKMLFESDLFSRKGIPARNGSPTLALPTPMPESLLPIRRRADPFPHNLILGTTASPLHTVTIFTDPACGSCRTNLNRWLKDLPLGTRLVYKYWPANPEDISSGLLMELSRRQGTAASFLRNLESARGDNLTATQLASLLDKSGTAVTDQHQLLREQMTDLTSVLGEDIDQAKHLRLGPPPQLLLDTYLLDGTILHPSRLKTYMERLNRKQPLAQPEDYFLNPGKN